MYFFDKYASSIPNSLKFVWPLHFWNYIVWRNQLCKERNIIGVFVTILFSNLDRRPFGHFNYIGDYRKRIPARNLWRLRLFIFAHIANTADLTITIIVIMLYRSPHNISYDCNACSVTAQSSGCQSGLHRSIWEVGFAYGGKIWSGLSLRWALTPSYFAYFELKPL